MSASSKQFFSNVLAVIAGVLCALLCLFLLSFICFYMGFIGWTDGGTKAEIRSLEIRMTISLIIIGLISALAGGYIARHIYTGKDWVPVIVTGILLTAALLVADDGLFDLATIVLLLLLIPATLAGGWLRKKPYEDRNP
ncbi:MAG TPA: hypothetical protein VHN59_05815 [Chitinophagaceae bacterium]|nr:hypothetical protein [Chitinophagaceae bacterium]